MSSVQFHFQFEKQSDAGDKIGLLLLLLLLLLAFSHCSRRTTAFDHLSRVGGRSLVALQ
jgi:hypothetical protein